MKIIKKIIGFLKKSANYIKTVSNKKTVEIDPALKFNHILAKSDGTTLIQHTNDVIKIAQKIAKELDIDSEVVKWGAILHDIGKVSTLFQPILDKNYVLF